MVGAARSAGFRGAIARVVDGFRRHDLLIEAGAIAFRTYLALLTGALCLVGVLGFLDLSEVWRQNVAPDVRASVSPSAYRLIEGAIEAVLQDQQVFWVSAGAILAVWQASSVVRATGQVLNRVHGCADGRSLRRELLGSILVGAAAAVLLVAALATVRLGPLAVEALLGDGTAAVIIGFVVRWTIAFAALTLALGLVVRAAPAVNRPLHWVTFGSVVVVSGWIGMSVLFAVYLSTIASFDSLFGGLATAFLLAEYLFLSAVILLGGLLLDARLEDAAES